MREDRVDIDVGVCVCVCMCVREGKEIEIR